MQLHYKEFNDIESVAILSSQVKFLCFKLSRSLPSFGDALNHCRAYTQISLYIEYRVMYFGYAQSRVGHYRWFLDILDGHTPSTILCITIKVMKTTLWSNSVLTIQIHSRCKINIYCVFFISITNRYECVWIFYDYICPPVV